MASKSLDRGSSAPKTPEETSHSTAAKRRGSRAEGAGITSNLAAQKQPINHKQRRIVSVCVLYLEREHQTAEGSHVRVNIRLIREPEVERQHERAVPSTVVGALNVDDVLHRYG